MAKAPARSVAVATLASVAKVAGVTTARIATTTTNEEEEEDKEEEG